VEPEFDLSRADGVLSSRNGTQGAAAQRAISRRSLLARGGSASLALGLSSFAAPAGWLQAAAAAGDGLSPARQRSFAALNEALALAPEAHIERSAAAAVASLVAEYAVASPEGRSNIDVSLDALEANHRSGTFVGLAPAERVGHLRSALRDDEMIGPLSRAYLVQQTIALAVRPDAGATSGWDPDTLVLQPSDG
jgi:hypothetical protein